MAGPVALGAAGPRARRPWPCCSSPPPSRCWSWRRSASFSTRRSRPAGTKSSGCCSAPSSASCWSTRPSLVAVGTVACAVLGVARRLAGRAHRPAGPPGLGGAGGAADHRPGLRHQLQLGLDHPGGAGLLGRRRDRHPRPTTRSSTCRWRRSLRGTDPALEESARSLGMGPWRTFFRVTLPQARVALLGGMLLVARPPAVRVRRLRDAALPDLHHGDLRRVQAELRRRRRLDAGARCWSCSACILLVAELGARGRGRYARVDSGAARRRRRPASAGQVGRRSGAPGADRRSPSACRWRTLVYWLATGNSAAELDLGALLARDRHLAQAGASARRC